MTGKATGAQASGAMEGVAYGLAGGLADVLPGEEAGGMAEPTVQPAKHNLRCNHRGSELCKVEPINETRSMAKR